VRTPYGLGQLIGTVQTIFSDPSRFIEDLNKYLRIKAPDVQRVAQKYLVPNNRSVVTLVPETATTTARSGSEARTGSEEQ
jgi:predicted Zn-dependent peptidase